MVSTSLLLLLPLFLLFLLTPSAVAAAAAAANLQTFFPSLPSPAIWAQPPPSSPPPPPPSAWPSPHPAAKESDVKLIKAVVATAAGSFALSGLLFFAFYRFSARQPRPPSSSAKPPKRNFSAIDPNGLDAVYWREFNPGRCDSCNGRLHGYAQHEDDPEADLAGDGRVEDAVPSPPRNYGRKTQETPLLPIGSISSSSEVFSESFRSGSLASGKFSVISAGTAPNSRSPLTRATSASSRPPLPPSWSSRLSLTASDASPVPPLSSRSTSKSTSALQPPPPPSATKPNAAPAPPAPPSPAMKSNAASPPPPPPPQVMMKSNTAPTPPPPPPPRNKNDKVPAAPPPPPALGGRPGGAPPSLPPPPWAAAAGEHGGKKLKPLHWDKLNRHDVEHSMVWDKITTDTSFGFEFDEGVMVELFGTLVGKKGTTHNKHTTSTTSSKAVGRSTAKATLLDPRKSQNMAIVLRSLALSRKSVVDALRDGRGLAADTLEKLTKVAPTKEEEALVRAYAGDPSELADAEAFLLHVLRAVPSPFARFDAMLFAFNYDAEMAHLKRSLHTLDLACKELKLRPGLFLKLLEAILKAGNLMNAGTARGNAEAFDLTALCRLSDVKSTDGSTTLLHFVVQEVVRSEGKRLAQVDRNNSTRKSGNLAGAGANLQRTSSRAAREEREKEYIKFGMPIVGGLSDQFANLKMAAGIDYDAVAGTSSALGARTAELKRFLETCSGADGFAREMKGFVHRAEEELRAARAEQERVLQLVRRTTQYYQAGGAPSKNKGAGDPLQLFLIVRDFLSMVDKACIDIFKDLQKRKKTAAPATATEPAATPATSASSKSSSNAPVSRRTRPPVRFPHLPVRFISKSDTSSSSSDEDDD